MQKLIAIAIAMAMVIGMSALSHADIIQTTKDIDVLMDVGSNFGFEIWDTEYSQDLGTVSPGIGNTGDIHIYATSNHASPWTVSASSIGVVGTTQVPPDTIPVVVSTFDGGAGLTGTVYTDVTLTGAATPIYVAGAGEYPVVGLEVNCIFAVTSDVSTLEDTYNGTITMTMTE